MLSRISKLVVIHAMTVIQRMDEISASSLLELGIGVGEKDKRGTESLCLSFCDHSFWDLNCKNAMIRIILSLGSSN